MLAKRWREQKDATAAQKLVTSHLRLVAKIAMGYRGYGLPEGELVSEGNVGLMQAVKRFEPERGFRLATYAMWWIRASVQEYVLRSWSLVRMGTTAHQKKLFFNLRKAKSRISAYEEGDLHPENVALIASKLGVPRQEVIDMNRRLAGDFLSTPRCAKREMANGRTPSSTAASIKNTLLSSGRKATIATLRCMALSTYSIRANGASWRRAALPKIEYPLETSRTNLEFRESACARLRYARSRRLSERCAIASRASRDFHRRCDREGSLDQLSAPQRNENEWSRRLPPSRT